MGLHIHTSAVGELPVDTDGREVEYRGRATEDVEGHPSVAQCIAQSPLTVIHLHR